MIFKCIFCGNEFKSHAEHVGQRVCDRCRQELESDIFIEAVLNPKKFKDRLKFPEENLGAE